MVAGLDAPLPFLYHEWKIEEPEWAYERVLPQIGLALMPILLLTPR
jgi:hypothetical protein